MIILKDNDEIHHTNNFINYDYYIDNKIIVTNKIPIMILLG